MLGIVVDDWRAIIILNNITTKMKIFNVLNCCSFFTNSTFHKFHTSYLCFPTLKKFLLKWPKAGLLEANSDDFSLLCDIAVSLRKVSHLLHFRKIISLGTDF